jgi:peptidoglycan-N-acetylglucosamine deacetylase
MTPEPQPTGYQAGRSSSSGRWPSDVQCAVCFTFDVEGPTEFLAMSPQWAHHPSLMSMSAFGPQQGVTRVLDLLDSYDIKATFFVPGYIAEQYPDAVRELINREHEVAHHGYLHEQPAGMTSEQQAQSLERGTEALASLTRRRPVGYRAPGPDTSVHMPELLQQQGFLYDSSLMGNDIPYTLETSHGKLLELPIHWSLMDKPHYIFAYEARRVGTMASVEQVHRNWILEFEGAYRYGRTIILALDPGYSGYLSRLMYLERFIRHIKSFPGVAILRAADLAQIWLEQQR